MTLTQLRKDARAARARADELDVAARTAKEQAVAAAVDAVALEQQVDRLEWEQTQLELIAQQDPDGSLGLALTEDGKVEGLPDGPTFGAEV